MEEPKRRVLSYPVHHESVDLVDCPTCRQRRGTPCTYKDGKMLGRKLNKRGRNAPAHYARVRLADMLPRDSDGKVILPPTEPLSVREVDSTFAPPASRKLVQGDSFPSRGHLMGELNRRFDQQRDTYSELCDLLSQLYGVIQRWDDRKVKLVEDRTMEAGG